MGEAVRQTGNVGNGDRPERHEPRRVARSPERVNEVAWHNGKNASATGARAVRERRKQAGEHPLFAEIQALSESDQERIAALLADQGEKP